MDMYSGPLQTSAVKRSLKIICKGNLKQLIILGKRYMLDDSLGKECVSQIQRSFLNLNGNVSLTTNKDGIILINSLHLKFRSINCLSIRIFVRKFLQIVIKAFVVLSKVLCLQHILLNIFRKRQLHYEKHSLRAILI